MSLLSKVIEGLHNRRWRQEQAKKEEHRARKAEWWEQNFGSDATKELPLRGGLKLKIWADSVLCRIIDTEAFELTEVRFVEAYLKPGDVFFDVGSNIGLFSVVSSSVVGATGEVHAFEPSSHTFSRLTENITRNGLKNVTLNHLALSSEPGTLELFVSTDGHDAWNSFAGKLAGESGQREETTVTTLDDYCARHKQPPDLIKIDVEGWEQNVVNGGTKTLSADAAPDLLVEFTEENCFAAGTSCTALYDSITSLGYELYSLSEGLDTIPTNREQDFGYRNLVATKDKNQVSSRLGKC